MYKNLRRHPQIQDLPGKELMLLSGHRSPARRAVRIEEWTRRWRRRYAKAPGRLEWGLEWLDRYSQAGESLDAYMKLFDVPAGRLAGDMSPDFCRLAADEVRDVRSRVGDIRVFMLARDPIERDWSHAKLALQYRKTDVQQSDDQYIEYICSPRCQLYSNYARMIDIWGENFTLFRIFYLDDIIKNPQETMQEVYKFLNIDLAPPNSSKIAPNSASKEIGKFVRTPQIYEAQKRISEPLMAALRDRLGGYPAAWYDRHFGGTPIPLESALAG
jgi:hypothetical protein